MTDFAFDWQPTGRNLSAFKLTRITDGDTPFIEMSIRMLSIDTPEVHFPGNSDPARHDSALDALRGRLENGEFPAIGAKLRARLVACLDQEAGSRQKEQGEQATVQYQAMLDQRLARGDGRRRVFVRAAEETFDHYGRLLAYVAPSYGKRERQAMSLYERRTFNLQLVEEGWAAPFLIYPSLPRRRDMELFWELARAARAEGKGCYADDKSLAGYEFRMCVRMAQGEGEGPTRYCADIRSGKVYRPWDYAEVEPEDRMFIWAQGLDQAVESLGLDKQWED